MLINILLLLLGLTAIIISANMLINSASKLARHLGVSSFVIGITVIAFGTSAPEFVIGIVSGISKTNELTFGNVVGSGVSNIAFILGVCAMLAPLPTKSGVIFREIPMLIFIETVLLGLIIFDNTLSIIDGVILVGMFILFLVYIVWDAKKNILSPSVDLPIENSEKQAEKGKNTKGWVLITMLALSLGGLFLGGNLTVNYSSEIAKTLGLSEAFIGVTVVAIATTLPELVASLVAIRKKETEIVLGNCIGSNIFNILLVTGISSIINPIAINATTFDKFWDFWNIDTVRICS